MFRGSIKSSQPEVGLEIEYLAILFYFYRKQVSSKKSNW